MLKTKPEGAKLFVIKEKFLFLKTKTPKERMEIRENIPSDKKSIALNVTIQSLQKSLNDKDLEKINNLIISTVESKTGAKIRS